MPLNQTLREVEGERHAIGRGYRVGEGRFRGIVDLQRCAGGERHRARTRAGRVGDLQRPSIDLDAAGEAVAPRFHHERSLARLDQLPAAIRATGPRNGVSLRVEGHRLIQRETPVHTVAGILRPDDLEIIGGVDHLVAPVEMQRVVLNHGAQALCADIERGDFGVTVIVAVLQHTARLDHAGPGLVAVKPHMGVLLQTLGSHLIDPVHLQAALHRDAASLVRCDDLIKLGVAVLLDDQRDPAAVRARCPFRAVAGEEFAVNLRSGDHLIRIGILAGRPVFREVDLTDKGVGRLVVRRRRIGESRRGAAREVRRRGRKIDEITAAEDHRTLERRFTRIRTARETCHGECRAATDRHRASAGEDNRPDRHRHIQRSQERRIGCKDTGVIHRKGDVVNAPIRRGGELPVTTLACPCVSGSGTHPSRKCGDRPNPTHSAHTHLSSNSVSTENDVYDKKKSYPSFSPKSSRKGQRTGTFGRSVFLSRMSRLFRIFLPRNGICGD